MKKMIGFSLILVLVDQIVKYLVVSNIKLGATYYIIKDFLFITYIKNSGAAFSILEGNVVLLIVLSFIVLGFLIFVMNQEKNLSKKMFFANIFLIGGVIGNLIDRIRFGSVIDYLFININFIPIFNLSDIFIVLGVSLFILEILRGDKYVTNSSK